MSKLHQSHATTPVIRFAIRTNHRSTLYFRRRLFTIGVVGTRESQSAERLSYVGDVALSEILRTCWVPLDMIRTVDQNLDSLLSCNTPEDYEKVVHRAFPKHKVLHE